MALAPLSVPPGLRRGGRRVLFADDDAGMRAIVLLNLQAEGFDVTAVEDGNDALREAERLLPDLIVLDVMMPQMTGHEAHDEIRRRGHETPILFLSAAGTFEEQVTQMQDDLTDYLPKPFKPSDVADHIEAMLDPKRREAVARERKQREAKLHHIVNIMHRDRD